MAFLMWILLALIAVTVIVAQTGNSVVDNGLAAGKELAQALGDKEFETTVGKLLTKVAPFLGMVGPVLGTIIALLGKTQESAELQFMRKMLSQIENRFDRVDNKLEDLSRKIDWNTVKINFFPYEKKILLMKAYLDQIYNASSNEEMTGLQNTFTRTYECAYENSGQMLYNHIVSSREFTFTENLLSEAMRAFKYDRKEMQIFMLGLTKLILVGSQIDMAYYKLKLQPSQEKIKNRWTEKMKRLSKAMRSADEAVKEKYWPAAMADAKEIAILNKGASNKAVASLIYKKMTTKYYWNSWFIGVSADIGGSSKIQSMFCNGEIVYNFNGFNLYLAISQISTKNIHNFRFDNVIAWTPTETKIFLMDYYTDMDAKEIFTVLKPKLSQDCSQISAIGLVRSSANLYCIAEKVRLSTTNKASYSFFLFQ